MPSNEMADSDQPRECSTCGASLTDRDAPECDECEVGDNWPDDFDIGNPVG
jgi:hypothetical protein